MSRWTGWWKRGAPPGLAPGAPERFAAPIAVQGESIGRGAALAMAAQATSALFTAGLTLYLVRALGAHDYGIFALAVSLAMLLLLPSDLGITAATARYVASDGDDRAAAARTIGDGLRLKLLVAVPLSALLIALAAPIASAYGLPRLTWPLRAVVLAMLAQGLMLFVGAAFAALQRLAWQLRAVICESGVETGASVLLVALAGGPTAAAFGRALGYALGAACAFALLLRAVGRGALPGLRAKWRSRQIVRYAGPLLIIDGAFSLFTQVDVLLLGAFIGASASGVFSATLRLAALLHYPGLAVAAAVAPRVIRAGRARFAPLQHALRWLLVLGALEVAAVEALAGPIAGLLFGRGYGQAATLLRVLAPYILLNAVAPLASLAVNYTGEARRRIPIAIAAVALNVVLDVILIPRIGLLGGAIGTDAAFALYVPAHLWLCGRMLGVDLRALAATLLRAMLAAGATVAALLPIATAGALSASAQLLAGALVGPLVFAAILLATGELGSSEARGLAIALRARAART
jgi:O-antigen/teichoic acid export membrane protein